MRLFFTLISAVVFAPMAFGQLKVTRLAKKDIPASINYTGKIINSVKYIDKDGEHMVITTETGVVKITEPDGSDFRKADLYAYHYNIKSDKPVLTWQLHDMSGECALDLEANYLPGTFELTDLNNNGVAEVWLMYKTACHGDVSPAIMKIIMHEGVKKYAMRGTNKVKVSQKEYYGGEYKFDANFNKASAVLKQYAVQLWKRNMVETWK